MIEVKVDSHRLSVTGHAGYAPRGQDIVCAAVSALTQTLIQGLEQVALMKVSSHERTGNVCIEWQHMNDTGKALVDTWFLGISSIADSYENCIRFI